MADFAIPALCEKDRKCTAVCLDEPRSVHVRFAAGHSAASAPVKPDWLGLSSYDFRRIEIPISTLDA